LEASLILVRDARPDDLTFVRDAWFRCMFNGRVDGIVENAGKPTLRFGLANHVRAAVLEKGFKDRVARLLQRSSCRVAYDAMAEDSLVGFIVFEGSIGHFRYVRGGKNGFRGLGVAKLLAKDLTITVCTHRSQGHAPGRMTQPYNPFLLEA
jgi:hypothetical protein